MIICAASGRSGAGKTAVATNVAVSIGTNVQLLDCDVEEPNAYFFIHPLFDETEIISTPVPQVDLNKCTRCGKCAEICQHKAMAVVGETVPTFSEPCHSCAGCMEVCPEGAISETGRELGIIQKGFFDSIEFIHGKFLLIADSPRHIQRVRGS
jgi:MinD superfamily P-loop ATPase